MVLNAVTTRADEGICACNPEAGTTSQGDSFDEVMSMLLEATELYLEEFPLARQHPFVMTGFEMAMFELPRRRHFEEADIKAPRFPGTGMHSQPYF